MSRARFAYDFATMKKRNKGLDTVAIVGAGNVARVLAVALLNAGVRVNEIVTRDSEESKKKGQKLARYLMARTSTVRDAKLDAKSIWVCVTDNAIAEVRRSFGGDYDPLYQCAYLIGGLQVRALHRELVTSGRMTDPEFHDALLRENCMPIAVLRALLSDLPLELRNDWRFYDGAIA